MEEKNLNNWINKIVEVIYDDGKEISKLTGNLESICNNYIILRTLSNRFCISNNRIIKIKLGDSNE